MAATTSFSVNDVTAALVRVLYPNWVTVSFFTENWGLFFSEEAYNLSVLCSAIIAFDFLIGTLSVTSVLMTVAGMVAVRRVLAGGLCGSTKDLTGQTVIVTGANAGVGKGTTKELLRRGAHVIMACRNLTKAAAARREVEGVGGKVEVRQLDLASLQSVRDFAAGIVKDGIKVHILINNAGVMMCPYSETEDGFEMQMGVNHLGHFLLTNLLLPQMKHGQPARIITLSSIGHLGAKMNIDDLFYKKRPYNAFEAYSNSKLANILFSRHLAKQLRGTQIQVFSLHPGSVHSDLMRHVMASFINNYIVRLGQKTPLEGAQTTVYCATEAKQHPDMYFTDCTVDWPIEASRDEVLAERLWKISAELVGLKA